MVTLPTFRLLYPDTNDAKLLTVDTSRKYAVAFADAAQFAEIDVQVTLLPADALGVAGVGGLTVIVPVAFAEPQPPVSGIVYVKLPAAVGVPLTVIVFEENEAETPAGRPVAVPIPVAPVVVRVIAVKGVFAQSVGLLDAVPAVTFV